MPDATRRAFVLAIIGFPAAALAGLCTVLLVPETRRYAELGGIEWPLVAVQYLGLVVGIWVFGSTQNHKRQQR